jgi:hypothetical protein
MKVHSVTEHRASDERSFNERWGNPNFIDGFIGGRRPAPPQVPDVSGLAGGGEGRNRPIFAGFVSENSYIRPMFKHPLDFL